MTPAANLPALRRLLEGGHVSDLCISGFIVRHRGLSAMRNLMSGRAEELSLSVPRPGGVKTQGTSGHGSHGRSSISRNLAQSRPAVNHISSVSGAIIGGAEDDHAVELPS